MTKYFLVANLWLLVSAVVYVGKTSMRSQPDRYAFFGTGQWFGPGEYTALIVAPFALSLVFFTVCLAKAVKRN
jgi:hypothetical protein